MGSNEQTVLQFVPSPASVSARVHPLVIYNICDCYVRRPDQAERVIGTLLGSVLPDGTVDVRNSYAVPHNESSDQVALDIDYHQNMLASHRKVNPKEVIGFVLDVVLIFQTKFSVFLNRNLIISLCAHAYVDRFSTGGVTPGSALIHEFYSREITNPVHLTVDTEFRSGNAAIKAFVSINLSLGDQQLAAQFQEIPLDLRMVEAERIGFDVLKPTNVDKLPNDLEGMEASMERLLALIDDIYKYVDNVVEGRIAADTKIGRFIYDAVASLPKLPPHIFDKLVNDSLQDQLLLLYLSSITRTQLSLAEKLNTAAQIL
ncbi:eukaryotic translation initiation factor 3subunit F [Striga asiatica]|uniref:Eukaryotic translation initiation factor 3 subunit F n=1 Tax=Striga asiatica TaxID=4170 RepID=A0A5A7QZV7_STRAF|nr:eukaryotic translation initiation factor 3subunit F [Striga asiatica]